LLDVLDWERPGPEAADVGRDLLADLLAYNEHDARDAEGFGCPSRIIHDGFAIRANRSELLQPSESAPMTGRKHHELHNVHPTTRNCENDVTTLVETLREC
jgi:hypothetical protein